MSQSEPFFFEAAKKGTIWTDKFQCNYIRFLSAFSEIDTVIFREILNMYAIDDATLNFGLHSLELQIW